MSHLRAPAKDVATATAAIPAASAASASVSSVALSLPTTSIPAEEGAYCFTCENLDSMERLNSTKVIGEERPLTLTERSRGKYWYQLDRRFIRSLTIRKTALAYFITARLPVDLALLGEGTKNLDFIRNFNHLLLQGLESLGIPYTPPLEVNQGFRDLFNLLTAPPKIDNVARRSAIHIPSDGDSWYLLNGEIPDSKNIPKILVAKTQGPSGPSLLSLAIHFYTLSGTGPADEAREHEGKVYQANWTEWCRARFGGAVPIPLTLAGKRRGALLDLLKGTSSTKRGPVPPLTIPNLRAFVEDFIAKLDKFLTLDNYFEAREVEGILDLFDDVTMPTLIAYCSELKAHSDELMRRWKEKSALIKRNFGIVESKAITLATTTPSVIMATAATTAPPSSSSSSSSSSASASCATTVSEHSETKDAKQETALVPAAATAATSLFSTGALAARSSAEGAFCICVEGDKIIPEQSGYIAGKSSTDSVTITREGGKKRYWCQSEAGLTDYFLHVLTNPTGKTESLKKIAENALSYFTNQTIILSLNRKTKESGIPIDEQTGWRVKNISGRDIVVLPVDNIDPASRIKLIDILTEAFKLGEIRSCELPSGEMVDYILKVAITPDMIATMKIYLSESGSVATATAQTTGAALGGMFSASAATATAATPVPAKKPAEVSHSSRSDNPLTWR